MKVIASNRKARPQSFQMGKPEELENKDLGFVFVFPNNKSNTILL